jgi:hypothetical protein
MRGSPLSCDKKFFRFSDFPLGVPTVLIDFKGCVEIKEDLKYGFPV